MKLTKEQAVHEHRMMWRWLAEFYAAIDRWNGKAPGIYDAKEIYFSLKNYEYDDNFCFCCEYIEQVESTCIFCPVVWHYKSGATALHCTEGEYGSLDSLHKPKDISDMCHIIAELPEREDV